MSKIRLSQNLFIINNFLNLSMMVFVTILVRFLNQGSNKDKKFNPDSNI